MLLSDIFVIVIQNRLQAEDSLILIFHISDRNLKEHFLSVERSHRKLLRSMHLSSGNHRNRTFERRTRMNMALRLKTTDYFVSPGQFPPNVRVRTVTSNKCKKYGRLHMYDISWFLLISMLGLRVNAMKNILVKNKTCNFHIFEYVSDGILTSHLSC